MKIVLKSKKSCHHPQFRGDSQLGGVVRSAIQCCHHPQFRGDSQRRINLIPIVCAVTTRNSEGIHSWMRILIHRERAVTTRNSEGIHSELDVGTMAFFAVTTRNSEGIHSTD